MTELFIIDIEFALKNRIELYEKQIKFWTYAPGEYKVYNEEIPAAVDMQAFLWWVYYKFIPLRFKIKHSTL